MSVRGMSVWSLPIHFHYNISVTFSLEFNASHGTVSCDVKNVLHNQMLLWYNKLRLGGLSYKNYFVILIGMIYFYRFCGYDIISSGSAA